MKKMLTSKERGRSWLQSDPKSRPKVFDAPENTTTIKFKYWLANRSYVCFKARNMCQPCCIIVGKTMKLTLSLKQYNTNFDFNAIKLLIFLAKKLIFLLKWFNKGDFCKIFLPNYW